MKWLLPLILLCMAPLVHALDYRVDINGLSEDEIELVRPQLDIESWHDSADMNVEQLQRLHAQTPERLRELLATWGYFSSEVSGSLEQDKEQGQWVAAYTITRGPQAVVRQLDIQFEGAITRPEIDAEGEQRRGELLRSWHLKPGERFSQARWREDKKLLLESLSAVRYPWALLRTSQARVSEDGRHVDLQLQFDSGPRVYFGQLRISGLKNYPVHTVSNLNTISPGSDFNREALLNYQSRLIQSGYFAGVLADIQRPDADPLLVPVNQAPSGSEAKVDIVVQLTELRQKQLRLGVGYSTDSRERISVGYEHRNFLNRGWRWSGLVKADENNQNVTTEIAFPAGDKLYQDSIGYSYEHDSVGESDSWDNRIYVRRHWGDTRFERTITIELLDEILRKLVVETDGTRSAERQGSITANAGYVWVQRNVDDLVFPTRGLTREFQVLIGSKFELRPYSRLYARFNHYRPTGSRALLLSRLELGQLLGSEGEIPSDYLFLSGGDTTVRGYRYQSIGLSDSSSSLGSKTMATGSIELQYWFTGKWGVASFFDAGNLGPRLLENDWYMGYGAGLRWRSPVGPLNLDYAWGRREHDYQIHLSIGLAF